MTHIKQASGQESLPQVVTLQEKDGLFLFQDKHFIPESQRLLVLKTCHHHPLAGHFGVQKNIYLVQRSFWWTKLKRDCEKYVR